MDVIQQRLVKGAPGAIRWSRLDADGDRTAALGNVTAAAVDANGDAVDLTGSNISSDAGIHTLNVPAAATASLARWTVTFTDAGDDLTSDIPVEVCTARLIALSELRDLEPDLADTKRYPADRLRRHVLSAENEVEYICDRAFTPRYARVVADGRYGDYLTIGHRDITQLLSVTIAGTALTAAQLADITIEDGYLHRAAGWGGDIADNVVVELIHGWSGPPPDLVEGIARRIRHNVFRPKSNIADRALTHNDDTGTTRLAQPGSLDTGIPWVDARYHRYSARMEHTTSADTGGELAAVSIPVDLDPFRDSSIFHRRR